MKDIDIIYIIIMAIEIVIVNVVFILFFIKNLFHYSQNKLENNYNTIAEKVFDICLLSIQAVFTITRFFESIINFINDVYIIDNTTVNIVSSISDYVTLVFVISLLADFICNQLRKLRQ